MIKSYTDLEQSKKLAEILPLESANMRYEYSPIERDDMQEPIIGFSISSMNYYQDIDSIRYLPCWSLAALLDVMPENKICHYDDRYYCQYISEGDEFPFYSTAEYDNPVDACVAMIEKLHELNLL